MKRKLFLGITIFLSLFNSYGQNDRESTIIFDSNQSWCVKLTINSDDSSISSAYISSDGEIGGVRHQKREIWEKLKITSSSVINSKIHYELTDGVLKYIIEYFKELEYITLFIVGIDKEDDGRKLMRDGLNNNNKGAESTNTIESENENYTINEETAEPPKTEEELINSTSNNTFNSKCEYYKIPLLNFSYTIYLDYNYEHHTDYLGNSYSINSYDYVPYVDADKSEYKNTTSTIRDVIPQTNFIRDQIVKVYEIYGHYGKVIGKNKETQQDEAWWIDISGLYKLTNEEAYYYENKALSDKHRNELENLQEFLFDNPILKWLAIIGLLLIFILEFSINRK